MSLHVFSSKVLFITSLLTAIVNHAALAENDLSSFVGVNVGNYKVFFEPGYGQKIFRKDAVFYNICAGIKFNNHVGLEVGHQHDNKRKNLKDSNHYPGNKPFHKSLDGVFFKTNLNIKHTYMGATFNCPLSEKVSFGSLHGISLSTVNASHSVYTIYGSLVDPITHRSMYFLRTYKKNKLISTHSLRLAYKLSDKFTFRVAVNYFNLSKININSAESGRVRGALSNAPTTQIRIRSPINYSVGLLINF